MARETMGLTDEEIDVLQVDRWCDAKARQVVDLYNMIVACPSDPGARGLFDAALSEWRGARKQQAPEQAAA